MSYRYTCPCCGHRMFDELPGSYDICEVCFWEDDAVQLRFPTSARGANRVSLVDAQHNYREFGANDEHARALVRPPAANEPLDPAWRPIDLTRDNFEDTHRAPWPDDLSMLYWWLPTFWRRSTPTK